MTQKTLTDLRFGRYQNALADVEEVDAIIADPPYSERTHSAHSRQGDRYTGSDYSKIKSQVGSLPRYDASIYQEIPYKHWTNEDIQSFVSDWSPRCRGWFVALTSHDLIPVYSSSLTSSGRYVFQPIPCVMRGMNVRLGGDGPSSWAVYAIVARPRNLEFSNWGTLPGAYFCPPGAEIIGGKPLALMRAIIRDYTRPGDLVCDPCAGGGTTLLAAAIEGRRAIGAEMDPDTFEKAKRRLDNGYTPTLPGMEASS